MFQVHVFTMPSSIKVELMMAGLVTDQTVEECDIEVPGQHVKTLTCASSLIQKLSFSKAKAQLKAKNIEIHEHEDYFFLGQREEELSKLGSQRTPEEQNELKRVRDLKWALKSDISGEIFLKAEWQKFGPEMPPIKSQNLFRKPKQAKNRRDKFDSQHHQLE
jgi:hypothetical protein